MRGVEEDKLFSPFVSLGEATVSYVEEVEEAVLDDSLNRTNAGVPILE